MKQAQIGLIGLAVMGQNLVLNMERNGYTVAVYNRTTSKMTEFVDEIGAKILSLLPRSKSLWPVWNVHAGS